MQLDISQAAVHSVDTVEVAAQRGDDKPRSEPTNVEVNYRFALGNLPVFGPGAKIKVAFAHQAQLAQLIYFWRLPQPAKEMACRSFDEALSTFQRDPAFFRLRNKDAQVEIKQVRLGYYAMTPSEFQRFYIPVYVFDATVKTPELPRYELRRHILAVNVPPDAAKQMSAVANPSACRAF